MKYETILEIDLKKLKNNIKKLVKSYDDYKYKIVDLKDNAHGMGFGIVNTLVNYGINYLLVGSLKESLEVRKLNKEVGILASYYVTMDEIYDCINNNINITIYNKKYIDLLCSLELKDDLNVEILIDNGSNLQGVNKKNDLEYIINKINETKHIKLVGIYSDLTSFGIEDKFYYKEVNNFLKIVKPYINNDLIIHLNEPIMYHNKIKYLNGIRFDLSVLGIEENINDDIFTKGRIKKIEKEYGALEFPNIDLELIFNITSEVMEVKKVTKGTLVGRSYIAKEDMYVGIIPIGHKDGITKSIKYVGINKYKREILSDDIDKLYVKVDENIFVKDRVYILNEERDIYDFLKNLHTNRYYLMSILNRNLTKKLINEEKNNDNLL